MTGEAVIICCSERVVVDAGGSRGSWETALASAWIWFLQRVSDAMGRRCGLRRRIDRCFWLDRRARGYWGRWGLSRGKKRVFVVGGRCGCSGVYIDVVE